MLTKNTCSVAQSCLTLCKPMDCSPPGSSVPGISQVDGFPFPPAGDFPNPWLKLTYPVSTSLAGRFVTTEPSGKPTY